MDNVIEFIKTPFRKNDPDTSKNIIKASLDTKILRSLKSCGVNGSTFSHIAEDINAKEVSVSSRLSQLVKKGYAIVLKDWNSVDEPTKLADIKPLVRKGTSGYNQRVFMITTEGEKHTWHTVVMILQDQN